MLSQFLGELIATVFAALIALGIAFIWRLLTRLPLLMVAIGAALLGVAAAFAIALGTMNLHTEGSPAGLVIFAVLGSATLACGVVGLTFTVRGFAGAAARSSMHVLACVGMLALVGIGVLGYWQTYFTAGGIARQARREAVEMPHRTYPGIAQLSGQRSVDVTDAYELAWKERGDAPAFRMLVAAPQFAYGTKVTETVDGPRHVDLRVVEAPATVARLRLQRDDSELPDPVYASLFGRLRASADWQGALFADEPPRAWRLAGFDCASPAFEPRTDVVGEAAPGCYEARGFLARWAPALSGPKRLRLDVRPDGRACSMTFLYRGRPATVTAPAACTDPASPRALAAAIRLLGRLENAVHAPPLGEQRLARAAEAVQMCEQADARNLDARRDLCTYAHSLANAELEMSPGAAQPLLVRAAAVEPGLARR